MKNWVGNENSVFKTLGASNHTDEERVQHDYVVLSPMVGLFGKRVMKAIL